jgi:hypothetical protein
VCAEGCAGNPLVGACILVRTLGEWVAWTPIYKPVTAILVTPFRFVKALVFHEKLNRG